MKIKETIKSAGFWSGLIGTLFLLLSAFGVDIGDETVSAIVNSVCSLLVVFGIISSPTQNEDSGEADGKENSPVGSDKAGEETDKTDNM